MIFTVKKLTVFFIFFIFHGLLFSSFVVDQNANFGKIYQGGVTWGDFDGDGDYEFIVFGTLPSGQDVLRYDFENGLPTNPFAKDPLISDNPRDGDIAAGDYDGDGILDIAITGWPGLLKIYKGGGAGTFTEVFSGTSFEYSMCEWVDIDADGDLDLFASGHIAGTLSYKTICVYNNGGSFEEEEYTAIPGLQDGDLAFGDYNSDGWPDLAITGRYEITYSTYIEKHIVSKIYKNLGYGEFEETSYLTKEIQHNGSVVWFDYDADGDLDLFISGYEKFATPEQRVYIFENSGAPNYNLTISTYLVGVEEGQIIAGDVNNDGYGDLFLVGKSTNDADAILYQYNGIKFVLAQRLYPLVYGAAAFCDYDSDGDIDLFYCGKDTSTEQGKSLLYKNTTADSNSNSPPSAPANPTASVSEGYLVLTWDAPFDDKTSTSALNYSLRVGTVSFSSGTISGCLATPFLGYNPPAKIEGTPGIQLAGIKEGVTYFWSVRAIDSSFSVSAWTQEQTIYVTGVPPCGISNLTALPGDKDGEIKLYWTAPGNDGTFGKCSSYDVRFSSLTQIDETNFSTAPVLTQDWKPKIGGWTEERTITGLRPGTTFYFAIKGSDGISYGYWSRNGVNALNWTYAQDIAPSSPTWRDPALNPGDGFITANWQLNTEIDISSYTLEMSSYSQTQGFTLVITTAHPVNTYTVTGLQNFNTYYFRLQAIDWREKQSLWSEVKSIYPYDTTPPAKITTLFALQGDAGEIALSWIATGDSNYTGDISNGKYRIAFATYSFDSSTTTFANNMKIEFSTSTSPGNNESFTVTGLSPDTTYYFRLSLSDESDNWSLPSEEAYAKTRDTVPPAAVTQIYGATGSNPGEILLTWIAPGDNGWEGEISGEFRIFYSTSYTKVLSSDYTKAQVVISTVCLPFSQHSTALSGLPAGATHYICLWTKDEEDNFSSKSSTISAKSQPDNAPPEVSINVPVNGASYGKLDLISGTAQDNYGSVSGVWISTSFPDGVWYSASGTQNWSFDISTFVFSEGTTHYIYVKARDSYGNETSTSSSPGIAISSFYFDKTPPQKITDLTVTTGTVSGSLILSWTAPSDFYSSVKKYLIRYSTVSNLTVYTQIISTQVSSPGTKQIYEVFNLVQDVTHFFEVASVDSVDFFASTSTFSDIKQGVPRYGPDTVTYFAVQISSSVYKGIPVDFTVFCQNSLYNLNHSTTTYKFEGSVNFSGTDVDFYPSSYTFTLSDAGRKFFARGAVFKTVGMKNFYVSFGSTRSVFSVEVIETPQITVSSSGGTVSLSSFTYLNIPQGAISASSSFKIDAISDATVYGKNFAFAITISPDTTFLKTSILYVEWIDNDGDNIDDRAQISEDDMALFLWDGVNWRIISETKNKTNNFFTANIYRTGTYAILTKNSQTINASSIKPKRKIITPYDNSDNNFIEFTGATTPSILRIYSPTGKKVYEGKDVNVWRGVTSSGKKLPGGVYFYEFVSPQGKTKGVVIIAK
ncbi:MAG: VCBS repeat-containing protein [Elusimicrobia bacterium]|nr:VCBS repeat-containing protein [Elusimicrobiota bacterium]